MRLIDNKHSMSKYRILEDEEMIEKCIQTDKELDIKIKKEF